MLHLFIRSCSHGLSNPIRDQHLLQLTEATTCKTLDSVVRYLTVRIPVTPWSTYMSTLLADAASQIVPMLKSQAAMPTPSTYMVIGSINSAQICLAQLATTRMGAVCKASNKLSNVIEEINAFYLTATCIPMFPGLPFLASDDTEHNIQGDDSGYSLDTATRWQRDEFEFLPSSQLLSDFNPP
jgi:hypothetical protein